MLAPRLIPESWNTDQLAHIPSIGESYTVVVMTNPGAPLNWIKEHANYQGDDCIKYPYEITHHGYGSIKYEGKRTTASRVMCIVAHGDQPFDGMDAAHSCGNGHLACMNPRHLSWKSRKDNVADAIAHNTWMRGTRTPQAVIDDEKAEYIFAMRGKETQQETADRLGISIGIVAKVQTGAQWSHVTGAIKGSVDKIVVRGEKSGNAKLTENDVREIRRLRGRMTQKDIGNMFGIDNSHVGKIQRKVWWGWVSDD